MTDKYNPEKISLIIGLGNPSEELANTYHNVGTQALFALANGAPFTPASTGTFSYARVGARIFVRPLVFMNESGIAVHDALQYFKTSPSQLLIIHDDADIPLGEYRLQFGRGEAGHHGIASVIQHIRTNEFWRVRIGIEQRTAILGTRKRAASFVLKSITRDHEAEFHRIFEELKKSL